MAALSQHFGEDYAHDIPEDIINASLMELEQKHALNEKYFQDIKAKLKQSNKQEEILKNKTSNC